VLVNFADVEIACPAAGRVEIASDGAEEGVAYGGVLAPGRAVVLRA
jgi:hypothetical protein